MSTEKVPIVFRQGPHLYLRPIEKADLAKFVPWFNDEEVTNNLGQNWPISMAEEERWYEEQIAKAGKDSIKLAIVLKEGHELIGSLGLHEINHINGTAVFGWVIGAKAQWGKGYGPEALRLLLSYAFEVLNLRKISASVFDFNGRSQRGLEKVGFQLEARFKEERYRSGRYVDELVYTLFRRDFKL